MTEELSFEKAINIVLNKCREAGTRLVTPAIVSFLLETSLNPETGRFYFEDPVSDTTMRTLIDDTVSQVEAVSLNKELLLSLQLIWETQNIENEAYWTERLADKAQQTTSLMDAILDLEAEGGASYDTLSELYQKIYSFLIFKNREILTEDKELAK